MKSENNIAVRIYFGRQGGGFAEPAAVAVGSITDGFQPFPPQRVRESEVWILQHRRNDTLYAKFSTDYLAADGTKAQVLICLLLPAGKKLDGGKSPFGMLNDLQELMMLYGVRDGRLIQQPMKIEPFNELVKEQRLRSLTMPLPVMVGTAPRVYQIHNDAALDKLMRSSRFPVLSTVAWLEIGRHCETTIDLTQQIISPPPPQDPNAGMGPVNMGGGASYEPYRAGTSLGDETVAVETAKRKNHLVKYIAVAVAGLLALFLIVGLVAGDDEPVVEETSALAESAADVLSQAEETDSVQDANTEAEAEDNSQAQLASEPQAEVATDVEEALTDAEKEAERIKKEQQKAAEEAKKAEEKKREEEKRKKDEEEQKKQAWQGQIKKHAQNCPIYLSSGGKLSSISFNDQSVTCVVDYPDLTIYDLSEKDRSALRSDVATVKKQYCGDLPPNIIVTVIQKDRVGRNIH